MINKTKRKFIIIILVSIVLIAVSCFLFRMSILPKGECKEKVDSPDKQYTLYGYWINGGSLSADALRVEVKNNTTGITKNIYWGYPENSIQMRWIDNENVSINDKKLNIYKDKYDWRETR